MTPLQQGLTTAKYLPLFVVLGGLFLAAKLARWRRIRARRRKGIQRWDCDDLVSHMIDERYHW
jgi:hypothetical protein